MEQRIKWNEFAKRCTSSISGVTLVEIAGDCRVLVEQHRGVIEYDPEKICVKATYGCIVVYGSCLQLAQMTNASLVISGRIQSVSIQRRG